MARTRAGYALKRFAIEEYSIAELCQNVHRLDSSLLEGCLVRHSSGVQLLAAPARAADDK